MALFKRDEGFFVGAILANVVTTELVILLVCFFCLLVVGADYSNVLILLFIMAVLLPILFYRHARSLWLSIDYLIDPPDKKPGLYPAD